MNSCRSWATSSRAAPRAAPRAPALSVAAAASARSSSKKPRVGPKSFPPKRKRCEFTPCCDFTPSCAAPAPARAGTATKVCLWRGLGRAPRARTSDQCRRSGSKRCRRPLNEPSPKPPEIQRRPRASTAPACPKRPPGASPLVCTRVQDQRAGSASAAAAAAAASPSPPPAPPPALLPASPPSASSADSSPMSSVATSCGEFSAAWAAAVAVEEAPPCEFTPSSAAPPPSLVALRVSRHRSSPKAPPAR